MTLTHHLPLRNNGPLWFIYRLYLILPNFYLDPCLFRLINNNFSGHVSFAHLFAVYFCLSIILFVLTNSVLYTVIAILWYPGFNSNNTSYSIYIIYYILYIIYYILYIIYYILYIIYYILYIIYYILYFLVTPFLSSDSESAVDSNNHNIDNHNNYSTNTNIEASNNQTNACTLANTLAKTHKVNPPTNTIENEATISHPQILVEDSMTVALMAEIMKDDDTNMETDVTDPITERKLLGPEDDSINPNTNN